ncbi:MAG: DUF1667 domain-containing protein [Clostridia bacterium]|nr:DUF1667 domain-containing protein [Clostridia bacterium]
MEVVCTVCPRGCNISVISEGEGYAVQGNGCMRGKDYALRELTMPMRNFSLALSVAGGDTDVVAVRTSAPVRRECIAEIALAARALTLSAPIKAGDVIISKVDGDSDLIAASTVNLKEGT